MLRSQTARYLLTLSCLFISTTATVTSNAVAEDEEVTELSTISVTGTEPEGAKISTSKLLKVPGAGNDPLKAVEALPGVVMGGFGPFSIPAVRGSSPNDNNYITDFVPVGYVFHNDGSSTYNDNLVEDFNLMAGAWGPEYRNALGAIIDTQLRDPYHEGFTTTLDLSFLRAGFLVESDLAKDHAAYFSYRQGLLEYYVENFIDEDELTFTEVPKNSDYQFKYHWKINSTSNIRLSATGAKDSVGLDFGEDSDEVAREPALEGGLAADQFYDNQTLLYDRQYAGGTYQKTALSHKKDNADFSLGTIIDVNFVADEYRIKNHFTTPLTGGDGIRYGFELESWDIQYTASGIYNPCNSDTETCQPISTGTPISDEDSFILNGLNAHTAYDWLVTPFWQVSAGATAGSNDFTDETTVEPRLSSRYEMTPDLSFTSAYGQHSQFPSNLLFIMEEYGNPDLNMPKADHYVIGFEYNLDDSWTAKLETYFKKMHELIVSNPDYDAFTNPNAPKYLNEADGEAYGLEFLINKNLTDNWYGWLSVSYSKTTRKNQLTGESFDYSYDRPWVLNLVSRHKWNRYMTYGFKWKYQSGSLFTPVDSSNPSTANYECNDRYYAVGSDLTNCAGTELPNVIADGPDIYIPNYKDQNSERLPAYHRLDFRIDFALSKHQVYYFEIINVYNRMNVSDYSYNEDYSDREEVTSLPTLFSLGAKLTF